MNNSAYHVFFTNLANPLKIEIITALKEKGRGSSVGELSEKLDVEQSKVSHALALLKKCKIVRMEQNGKQRIYFLNKETIVPMLKLIDKHSRENCECNSCSSKNCGRLK
jgi:ArsR family transcriptional regulator, zinc-responsive transcriptional repressor